MSRITCDYTDCKFNYNGVCDKSFVEIRGTVCQDREEEENDGQQSEPPRHLQ